MQKRGCRRHQAFAMAVKELIGIVTHVYVRRSKIVCIDNRRHKNLQDILQLYLNEASLCPNARAQDRPSSFPRLPMIRGATRLDRVNGLLRPLLLELRLMLMGRSIDCPAVEGSCCALLHEAWLRRAELRLTIFALFSGPRCSWQCRCIPMIRQA